MSLSKIALGLGLVVAQERTCKNCCQIWKGDQNCDAENCWVWAHEYDQCNVNPNYMLVMCPEACESALQQEADPLAQDWACQEWAERGECQNHVDYMAKHCGGYCLTVSVSESKMIGSVQGEVQSTEPISDSELSCGIEAITFKLKGENLTTKQRVNSNCECEELCRGQNFWAYRISSGNCSCYGEEAKMKVLKVVQPSNSTEKKIKYVVSKVAECSKGCPWREG